MSGSASRFHCCIQKSGSRWFAALFRRHEVLSSLKIPIVDPGKDYIYTERNRPELRSSGFPEPGIVSPLYVRFDDFFAMPKPDDWRAVWVMRDPRDIFVSQYYSITYSHNVIN